MDCPSRATATGNGWSSESSSPAARLCAARAVDVGGPALSALSAVLADSHVARCNRHDRVRGADEGVRVGAEPAEEFCRLRGAAVVDGDTRGDPDRCRPFGRVVGGQEFVGQPAGGGAVARQCQRVGQSGADRGRSRFRRGTVKPCRPCRLAPAVGRQVDQCVGQPIVLQAVFGHPQREIRRQRRQFDL